MSEARLGELVLIAITDFSRVPPELTVERAERLMSAAEPGTVAVQLRDGSPPTPALRATGARLRDVTRAWGHAFIVNDRLDWARELGADAIHLKETSVLPADARELWGKRGVYRACHDPEAVARLEADGVLLSPIMAARKGNPALGLAALERARALIDASGRATRLFALGGVDATNAAACVAAGAHGVAVIGAAFDVEDATPLVRALGIERRGTKP